MKLLVIACMLLAFSTVACAQNLKDVQRGHGSVEPAVGAQSILPADESESEFSGIDDGVKAVPVDTLSDSLALIMANVPYYRPTIFTLAAPDTPFGAWSTWDIHSGMNVMLNAGVTIGFGRNNPFRNGAFFTNASAIYAKQVSDRWTIGLGGYLSRFSMSHDSYTDFGLQALASYKINDRMNATFYGLHSFAPQDDGFFSYSPFGQASTTIGAQLDVKVNDVVSFQVGVSRTYMNGGHGLERRHRILQESDLK